MTCFSQVEHMLNVLSATLTRYLQRRRRLFLHRRPGVKNLVKLALVKKKRRRKKLIWLSSVFLN